MGSAEGADGTTWLLLTHHIPPEPAYFRVRIRRRLDRIGAVALKNSVYVLPSTDESLEDFQWLFQEIERGGGEATISEARFVDGVTEVRLSDAFRDARDADYRDIVASARVLRDELQAEEGAGPALRARVHRLARRLGDVVAIDFFGASGRLDAEDAVASLTRLDPEGPGPAAVAAAAEVGRGRTWVTRAGVRVDRIASAWLVRRFIDPEARFVFVDPRAYEVAEGDLRFDMFEGEFTHVGEACTFEALLARFGLDEPALAAIGELVHDVDCKDEKFGRPEASGFAALIDGIARRHADDEARLERGCALLDELHEHFRVGGA